MKKYDFGFYLTRFLTTYLPSQRGIKANTQLSYRDTFSLLLIYCKEQESIQPDKVKLQLLDRELINRFLNWLEEIRNCKPAEISVWRQYTLFFVFSSLNALKK